MNCLCEGLAKKDVPDVREEIAKYRKVLYQLLLQSLTFVALQGGGGTPEMLARLHAEV